MASIIALTDKLLAGTVGLPLQDFVKQHVEGGGDANSLQAALFTATGQGYDLRTVKNWIQLYA